MLSLSFNGAPFAYLLLPNNIRSEICKLGSITSATVGIQAQKRGNNLPVGQANDASVRQNKYFLREIAESFLYLNKDVFMYINNNAHSDHIYQMQNNTSNNSKYTSDTITKNKTTSDTAGISNEGLNAKSNWKETANNYDVTNMSKNEAGNMVSNLMDNKLISPADGLYLMAPTSMNQDPEVKYDLLASMRKRLASAIENGSSQEQIKNTEKALSILEKLQELSS